MKNRLILLSLSLIVLAGACKKDDSPSGGKGGNAVLNIYPAHHTVDSNLINMKVYIKYNASDKPSSYDDSAVCSRGADRKLVATISGLKAGNYYLLGMGYDTSISQSVKGGLPYTITSETAQNVALPVSEY